MGAFKGPAVLCRRVGENPGKPHEMLATIAAVVIVVLLVGLLVVQRNRARATRGVLLGAIEAEARAERAAAEQAPATEATLERGAGGRTRAGGP